MQTQVLGLSVDSVPCLSAWAESLGGITYPLLSDFYPHGQVAERYGVLRPEGFSERTVVVVDKLGLIRYIEVYDIDQQPDNDDLFAVLDELEPTLRRTRSSNHDDAETEEPAAGIVMYCTPWCPDCKLARKFLEQRGIEYTEVDISRDRAAAERVREWGNGKEITPTFNIRGNILVDFHPVRLEEALRRARPS